MHGMKINWVIKSLVGITLAVVLNGCKKDPCKNVKCENGGRCVDGNCQCSMPFHGSKCEQDHRDKFVGTWLGPSCENPSRTDTCIISKWPPNALVVNLVRPGDDISLHATLTSPTTFSIQAQHQNVSFNGSGQLSNDTLYYSLSISVSGTSYPPCNLRLTKAR